MTEESTIVIEKTYEGMSDFVSRFFNFFKAELIMKGYKIKKEWDVTEKEGLLKKRDMGGRLKAKKKSGEKVEIIAECAAPSFDIEFKVWNDGKNSISSSSIQELQIIAEKCKDKLN